MFADTLRQETAFTVDRGVNRSCIIYIPCSDLAQICSIAFVLMGIAWRGTNIL